MLLAIVQINLADATWISIGPAQAFEMHGAVQTFCESRGLRVSFWWSKAESTWMLFDLGRWDELLAMMDQVTAASNDIGMQAVELGLPYQALVVMRRGNSQTAAGIVGEALPKARSGRDMQVLVPSLSVAALAEAALGDMDTALGFVRELIDASRGGSDRHRSVFLPELTRLCISAGALDLARELSDGLTVELGRMGCTRAGAAAELEEAEGRTSEALALHLESARRWRAFGGAPGLADALLGAGRCQISLGDSGTVASLTEARELYAQLGHIAGMAATDALLAK